MITLFIELIIASIFFTVGWLSHYSIIRGKIVKIIEELDECAGMGEFESKTYKFLRRFL